MKKKLDQQSAMVWLAGVGGVWVVLTLMVDLGDTQELAVALAIVIMGSTLMVYGPEALQALGFLPQGGAVSGIP